MPQCLIDQEMEDDRWPTLFLSLKKVSEGATKGLRVIHSVDPWVLKLTIIYLKMVCWYYFKVQGVLLMKTSLLFTKTLVDTLVDHIGC